MSTYTRGKRRLKKLIAESSLNCHCDSGIDAIFLRNLLVMLETPSLQLQANKY